jgi:two-component system, cell cycle sensor histidine kinase and response regulator CckA
MAAISRLRARAARYGEAPNPPHGTETILVAEDEPALLNWTTRMLREHGYTVLRAINGEDALRVAQGYAAPIDLLLTDIVMPRMGGEALAAHFRAMHPQAKVLFASGYTDSTSFATGRPLQGALFTAKPFSSAALIHKIREVLDT